MVRPLTVHALAAVEQVNAPGLEVTVYVEMAAPPLDAGVDHDTAAEVAEEVARAVTPVGALAVVAGTTGAEAPEAGLVPAELVAVTVKV